MVKTYDKIEFHDDEPDKLGRRYFSMYWTDPNGRYEPRKSSQDDAPVGYRHAQVFRSNRWREFEARSAVVSRSE